MCPSGGARRGVDVEAGAAAEQSDAKKMRAVADDDDSVEVVRGRDLRELCHLLLRVEGVGLGDDVVERNAVCQQVVAADSALGAAGVLFRASAERDDCRRDAVVVQGNGLVEPRVQDRRGAAGVLGGAEDRDGVGAFSVIDVRGVLDLAVEPHKPADGNNENDEKKPSQQTRAEAAARGRVAG